MNPFKAVICLFVFSLLGEPVSAQVLKGPRLGAAANFSQGWRPDILDAAAKLPVLDFRDTVHWAVAEKAGSRYDFRGWRTAFPGVLRSRELELGLFLNANHQKYDGGNTAHSENSVRAFGAYAAAVVAQYSNIRSVEMGNEFNGEDFVSGPAQTYDMDARAGYYVALLQALHTEVKAFDPTIRITGGGVHSIPVAYLEKVFAQGAAAYMDALAIHTYTTPAEHLVRQIAVLRRLPEAQTMPIEVTEFGTLNAKKAAGLFLRNYCQMALSGVDRAVWYPLHPRGDGLIPLLQDDGAVTSVGAAYGFAQAEFTGQDVVPFAPDPFTYGCLFGGRKLVIWGEPRGIAVAGNVSVYTAKGARQKASNLRLDRNDPLVLIAPLALNVERDVQLDHQTTVADSFHQLVYDGSAPEKASGWNSYFADSSGLRKFQSMPGQERQGVPWVPYLGHPSLSDLRLAADYLVPTANADGPVDVVQNYTAGENMVVAVDGFWEVSTQSEDGVQVSIYRNDVKLFDAVNTDILRLTERRVTLKTGDTLSFRVGPNKSPWGDYTEFRVTLRKNAPAHFSELSMK